MAQSLARTISLLHTSGWLHKSIRSSNVLLFQEPETNTPVFETPYLSGFGFSRPDGFDEETFHERSARVSSNQLYRHPGVQVPGNPRRYLASDDRYSLGLVLLEIGLWMPLAAIEGRGELNSPEHLDFGRIRAAMSSLPRSVGRIYTQAVESCLDPPAAMSYSVLEQSRAEWNAERLRRQNEFYWDVVKKLEDCRA